MTRTYTELSRLKTFYERYEYLKLAGKLGEETFGMDRYLNQNFYTSEEWRHIRNLVIIRDNGCDLGIPELPIRGKILIHHMNPITMDDILSHSDALINPEFLIATSFDTHNAIHYGTNLQSTELIERSKNDTCPWKKS